MKFKNRELAEHSLEELKWIDTELEQQHQNHIRASNHPKFEKMTPIAPSKAFLALREEVTKLIKEKENA